MPIRYPQPYRGQPRPKYPKPKKQIRNLNREKWGTRITVVVLSTLSLFILLYAIYRFQINHNIFLLGVSIFMFLIILTLTFAVADGLKSINRFRRNYDIDISEETKNENAEHSEDTEKPN